MIDRGHPFDFPNHHSMTTDPFHLSPPHEDTPDLPAELAGVDARLRSLAAAASEQPGLPGRVFEASRGLLATAPAAYSFGAHRERIGLRGRLAMAAGMALAFGIGCWALLQPPAGISRDTTTTPFQLVMQPIGDPSNPEHDFDVETVENTLGLSDVRYADVQRELKWLSGALSLRSPGR